MKQVLLIREDLDMSKGKAVAQGSHVSVLAVQKSEDDLVQDWLDEGGKKITLSVSSEEELQEVLNDIDDIKTARIRDHGHTELEPDTLTAGAIGPYNEDKIDKYTGNLPLFK